MLDARRGASILDGAPWSRCYKTADDGWLSVQCLEPHFFALFREKLGVGDDAAFEQNPDPETWAPLAAKIAAVIGSKTLDEWSVLFEVYDACVAPVLEPSRAAAHPHCVARGIWTKIDGQLQARAAPRFGGRPTAEPNPAPRRGEHTAEILASLGFG